MSSGLPGDVAAILRYFPGSQSARMARSLARERHLNIQEREAEFPPPTGGPFANPLLARSRLSSVSARPTSLP